MNKPLLSIVIANYNYGRFLEEAIRSVLSQSCDDYELIIVDGGSTDNSVEVIKKYEDKIAWWVSEKDKGQSDAFNKGFARANGKFLTWLNADDVMLPGVIEKLKYASEKHPKCEWFVGGSLWLDEELNIYKCCPSKKFSVLRAKNGLVSVWGPSSFFTKRLLEDAGGVDERLHYTMDTYLWLNFAVRLKVCYQIFCGYAFGLRLHKDAKMSAHMFQESGQAKNENHPKWRQLKEERKIREEKFPRKNNALLIRLLTNDYIHSLKGVKHTMQYKGCNYLKMFNREADRKVKLAFVSTHPAPYRDTLLKDLSKRADIECDIYSQFRHDLGHPFWELSPPPYSMKIIMHRGGSTVAAFIRCMRWFLFGKYDVVCWNGYMPYWYMLLPMFFSALFGRCYGIYADSVDERANRGFRHWVKRFIINRASFFFVPGRASENFFVQKYNVLREKICYGAYALDGKLLEKEIVQLRNHKTDLRKKYNISPDEVVFLMVANMIPNRMYPITTSAFINITSEHQGCRYIIVGKGPDLENMQELSKTHNEIIVVPGCSFEEMKSLYALSDIYVHGGREPASTALVIGGIASLPLISSHAVGCCLDCVENEVSGYVVKNCASIKDWELAFKWMLDNRDKWHYMGSEARRKSKDLDVDVVVESFINLIKRICV